MLHAPRQTGKTSTLLALRNLLNGDTAGDYRCVYVNVEAGQAARENVESAMRAILSELAARARRTLGDELPGRLWHQALEYAGPSGALREVLGRWAESDPAPLVLLIDEIDSLIGDTLIAVLRQLRAGYDERPSGFPQSVILCGVRDVRDYHRRQRLQHQGQVAAPRRLLPGRGARAARPAHRGHRTALRRTGAAGGVGADLRAAVAGQRAGAGGLFRPPRGARPQPRDHRRGDPRRPRVAHPAPGDPPGAAHRQAAGRARAAGDRTAAQRRRRA